jgi:KDO2-lipid IV(A) lauroyltransferase
MLKNFFSFTGYLAFRLLMRVFYLIPFFVLYRISDLLYFILYYLIGYRKKTVRENLMKCFPKLNESEIISIEKKFYKHLSDIFLEGMKGMLLSDREIVKRYKILTPESPNQPFRSGSPSLFAGSHFNNWEYGGFGCRIQIEPDVIVFYKPIKNKFIDSFIRNQREKKGTIFAPISETSAYFEKLYDQHPMFIMLSDQGPSNVKDAHSIPFFGVDTLFLHGLAKYAKIYNLPLYFFSTVKVKRGFYEVTGELLLDNPQNFSEREITEIYVRRLEKLIQSAPEFWLWSHKRWKRTKTD